KKSRSSNTRKMNMQYEKEEKNLTKVLAESVSHLNVSAHQMKDTGKPESELNSSEGRKTQDLLCTVQKMKQETGCRKTGLKPVSGHVEPVKEGLHTPEEIKYMVDLKTPFPNAEKSEIGLMLYDTPWDAVPRKKWGSPTSEKRALNQKDSLTTVLKPLGFIALISSEPKSQSYTDFVGKKSIMSPKHVTLKAKKLPISQFVSIPVFHTGGHKKKKQHNFKDKMKKRQQNASVGEALHSTTHPLMIPPPKLVIDKLSFDTTERVTESNGARPKNLRSYIAEEKRELPQHLGTTFVEPLDFLMPVLYDCKSQINPVQISEKKIIMNPKCLSRKEKKSPISQILKINGQLLTKQKKKLESDFKTKMKERFRGKNAVGTFPNTIYFTPDTSAIKKQRRSKTGTDTIRVSKFSRLQLPQAEAPVEGIARHSQSTGKRSASNILKEPKLHDGESEEEKQEHLIETGPVYTKTFMVNSYLIMESDPGKSQDAILGESFSPRSQSYKGNPEEKLEIKKRSINKKQEQNFKAQTREREKDK
uniref:Uncharacterized protein n=1 Tax=Loxodonta africana TaxID=9785 RepID=G3U9Q3_LOXAF